MLLSPALDGLQDEGRYGQKPKKFWVIFYKILIVNISAFKPSIEKIWKQFVKIGLVVLNISTLFWSGCSLRLGCEKYPEVWMS